MSVDVRNAHGKLETVPFGMEGIGLPHVALTEQGVPVMAERIEGDGSVLARVLTGPNASKTLSFPGESLKVPIMRHENPHDQVETDTFYTVAEQSAPFLATYGVPTATIRFDVYNAKFAVLRQTMTETRQ